LGLQIDEISLAKKVLMQPCALVKLKSKSKGVEINSSKGQIFRAKGATSQWKDALIHIFLIFCSF